MPSRSQRTIARSARVSGFGFFTGADVTLEFRPAPAGHGVAFWRCDQADSAPIPALAEFTVPRERRTAVSFRGVTVELVEHVLAALAGLQIDNCLVVLDAPEPPGGDGSSRAFVEALLDAGICSQDVPQPQVVITQADCLMNAQGTQWIKFRPSNEHQYTLSYTLDYGPQPSLHPQHARYTADPATFPRDIAPARTFLLEREARELQAQGIGLRVTPRDLLIFGDHGPLDNALRFDNECARHKVLDCLGDLALLGCDLVGTVEAYRSGHRLNVEAARRIRQAQRISQPGESTAGLPRLQADAA